MNKNKKIYNKCKNMKLDNMYVLQLIKKCLKKVVRHIVIIYIKL